jgi:NAD(P)-dependent dehydrogenase (short-subunit alcohol dehydrogenase family)
MASSTSVGRRVVAISGGARGIGLATARALHAAGAKVAIGDIDRDAAVAAAESIGTDVLASGLDVADRASFDQFLALTERELGPLDVLINNAGIMPIGPMLDEPDSLARRAVEINVLGPLQGMKAVLPGMLSRRRGHIVNVASVAGKSPVPGGATYAATKAAIVSLTETARVEYRGSGIDFTCVMPSFTNTDLINGTKGTRFVSTIEPEDVAEAIAGAVERPRPDVYVPRSVGAILKMAPFQGRRLRDAINRSLGADRTFLDIDHGARAGYEKRIAGASDDGSGADTHPAGDAERLTRHE